MYTFKTKKEMFEAVKRWSDLAVEKRKEVNNGENYIATTPNGMVLVFGVFGGVQMHDPNDLYGIYELYENGTYKYIEFDM